MYRSTHLQALVLGLALLVGAAVPRDVAAQTVEGRVEGAEGRVLVTLLDADGRAQVRRVTDRLGVFQFAAPGPGRYRIRVDRVGFEPATGDWVEVDGRARTTTDAPLPLRRKNLTTLPSPEVGQCRDVSSAPDRLAAAWVEVEEALRLLKWAEDGGELLLDAEVHSRRLETDGETVASADPVRYREGVQRVTPPVNAADLIERGFIREADDGGYRYFSVTPEVLLDPAFHRTHCFRLLDEGALLGLAFEPLVREDARPDVAGVIWVEATSGTPLLLEFGYRNVDPTLVPANVSGRSTLAELPDGSWILPETQLRMPLLQVRDDVGSGEQSWSVIGLLEDRVRVTTARIGGASFEIRPTSGSIGGEVRSVDGEPLRGARVQLVGSPMTTTTDSNGEFLFPEVLDGAWRIAAEHPDFDALPLGPSTQVVRVSPGARSSVTFAPPTPIEAATELCAADRGLGNSAALIGQVRDSLSGEPIVGLPVGVRFSDPRRDGTPYHEATVATGAGGFYLYCDAPAGQRVRLRAQTPGADFEDDVEFFASSGVVRRDLVVELSTAAALGGVFGLIRDEQTGRPIEQASVRVRDGEAGGLTNTNGFYAFDELEPGMYVLEISHIAYQDREVVVRLDGGTALQVNVDLRTDAIPLEGITVSVLPRRLFSDMIDLQRRMELGFGEFLVRSDLEIRGGTIANALTGLGGVRVLTGTGRAGERYIVLRAARDLVDNSQARSDAREDFGAAGEITFNYCFPAVWVDGRRFSRPRAGGVGHDPVDFSQFLTAEIEAVEIYRGAGSVPGEFGGGDAACGAVVLWTRRGGRTIRGEMVNGRGGGGEGELRMPAWPEGR